MKPDRRIPLSDRVVGKVWEAQLGSKQAHIRVLCADDHPLVREGIFALISNQADMELVGEASDGVEAVEQYRALRPDVALMDLQMPRLSGIDAISQIRGDFPNAKVIVLTTYDGDDLVKRAILAGAQGYLLKSSVRRELLDVIRAVHRGNRHVDPDVATGLASHLGDDMLTAREIAVLRLISLGSSNKLVAAELSIAEETVKGHVKSILSKLRVNDRTHAVTTGLKRGIIEL